MYSKIKIAGHPLHVMLVPFPIAFYAGAMAAFIYSHFTGELFWFRVGVVSNCAGVVMAIFAAVPGFVDWLNVPKVKKAKKTGLLHMLCNVFALILFGINAYIQNPKWNDLEPDDTNAILLTCCGFGLTIVAGFLGWAMVQNHHIGVSLTAEQQRIEPVDGVK